MSRYMFLWKPGRASPYEKTLPFHRDSRLNCYENPQNFHIFRASFVELIWNYHMYPRKFFTKCFSRVPKSSVISWKLSRINMIFSYHFDKNCSENMEVLGVFVKIKSRIAKKRFSRKVRHDQASVCFYIHCSQCYFDDTE